MMQKDLFKFLVLLAVALGAQPAYSAYWQWAKVAASNAGADPSINWSEGMSPSSVNDSARAMMARSAEERDDTSGLLVSSGSGTAYSVTTNQGMNTPTPTEGQLIAFSAHITNGINPTLTVDGGTAYPIYSSLFVPVAAGALVGGSPYTLRFSGGNGGWMLRDFYSNPFTVPLGAMLPFTGDTPPNSNFILPIGQCISRTTYAAYFAQVGTRFGACDGTTTFAAPDMRERTLYGSVMGGSDPGRISATYFGSNPTVIGSVGGVDHAAVLQSNFPNVNFTISATAASHTHATNGGGNFFEQGGTDGVGATANLGPDIQMRIANVTAASGPLAVTGTAASGGSGTPLSTISSGIVLSFILRVL